MQLQTFEQLLSGKKVDCLHSVSSARVNATFKKAPKAKKPSKKSKEKQSRLSEHSQIVG